MNPRPLGPEPSALPTALHPGKKKPQQLRCCGVVGDERIELPRAESESAALPLCESPSGFVLGVCPQRSYIIACPVGFVNAFFEKTLLFLRTFLSLQKFCDTVPNFCLLLAEDTREDLPFGQLGGHILLRFGFAWGFTLSADTVCPTRCRP